MSQLHTWLGPVATHGVGTCRRIQHRYLPLALGIAQAVRRHLETLNSAQRNDLMEIMDGRHGHTSTVMISQPLTDQWYVGIGDNTLADAILDRLMHNAHQFQFKGGSMRKIMGQLADDEPLG